MLATSGDAHLGGADFDAVLLAYLVELARDAAGGDLDSSAIDELRSRVEEAKRRLSVLTQVAVRLPRGGADEAHCEEEGASGVAEVPKGGCAPGWVVLSRAEFEARSEDLLTRLRAPLYEVAISARIAMPGETEVAPPTRRRPKGRRRQAEADAAEPPRLPTRKYSQVDEIVMVGGGSHMSAVRKLVANLFGVEPRRTVDPMHAVALGAAVYAGMLGGVVRGRVLAAWQVSE